MTPLILGARLSWAMVTSINVGLRGPSPQDAAALTPETALIGPH
ncbi:MAG: hypothetical protein WD646_03720 [Actinomycetota bacterium]